MAETKGFLEAATAGTTPAVVYPDELGQGKAEGDLGVCRRLVPQLRFLPFYIGKIPLYNGGMELTVTIDKAGRVVIPKEMRDELRLRAGDTLAIKCEAERLTLQPVHAGTPLRKERGIWVFHGGEPLSVDQANQLVRDVREQRDRHNAGERSR